MGTLLSKDSLNKSRAWEVDRAASVCPNCSQGCNMVVETRDNVVQKGPRREREGAELFGFARSDNPLSGLKPTLRYPARQPSYLHCDLGERRLLHCGGIHIPPRSVGKSLHLLHRSQVE